MNAMILCIYDYIIPEQRISEGTLQVVVRDTTISGISYKGNNYYTDKELSRYSTLKTGDYYDSYQAKVDLSWLNRSAFRDVFIIGRR